MVFQKIIFLMHQYKCIEIDRTNESHLQVIKECEDFMEKLFPLPDLRRYMWDNLSSCLLEQLPTKLYIFGIIQMVEMVNLN